MLELAGLPPRSGYSHGIPEFKVTIPKLTVNRQVVETAKEVDFLVEDLSRYINFLVEVKTANTRIDDDARVQLEKYLKYSNTRFGVLIDPFLVEIYEYTQWQRTLRYKYDIENPEKDLVATKPQMLPLPTWVEFEKSGLTRRCDNVVWLMIMIM
jgi:chromosome partitioning protein